MVIARAAAVLRRVNPLAVNRQLRVRVVTPCTRISESARTLSRRAVAVAAHRSRAVLRLLAASPSALLLRRAVLPHLAASPSAVLPRRAASPSAVLRHLAASPSAVLRHLAASPSAVLLHLAASPRVLLLKRAVRRLAVARRAAAMATCLMDFAISSVRRRAFAQRQSSTVVPIPVRLHS